MRDVRTQIGNSPRPYEPTPRDIRCACEAIQSSWTERERRKRSGRRGVWGWTPPRVEAAILAASADDLRDAGEVGIPAEWS